MPFVNQTNFSKRFNSVIIIFKTFVQIRFVDPSYISNKTVFDYKLRWIDL